MLKDGKWTKITPEIWDYLKNIANVEGVKNGFFSPDKWNIDGEEEVDYVRWDGDDYTFLWHGSADCWFDAQGDSDRSWFDDQDVEWVAGEFEKLIQIPNSNICKFKYEQCSDVTMYAVRGSHGYILYAYRTCSYCGKPLEILKIRRGSIDKTCTRNREILADDIFCCADHEEEFGIEHLGYVRLKNGKTENLEWMEGDMDDEIKEVVREELKIGMFPSPEDNQKFYDRYCELHAEKYGEDFIF